jgi:hypothetical protein
VLTTPAVDDNGKVKKAAAAIEELSTSTVEAQTPSNPEPNGSATAAESEVPIEQLQQQLVQELNALIGRLKELSPAFTPAQVPGPPDERSKTSRKTNFEAGPAAGDYSISTLEGRVVHPEPNGSVPGQHR